MPEKGAVVRLQKELMFLLTDPVPYIVAKPDPANILEWYYVLEGPSDTPFTGGYYFGTIQFPFNYPWKPPAFYMYTPNGRFQPSTRLCLSMSDYHPETWSEAWRVSTLLNGLLSFMVSSETGHIGGIITSARDKAKLAKQSMAWNEANPKFREIFPEFLTGAPPSLATVSKKTTKLELPPVAAVSAPVVPAAAAAATTAQRMPAASASASTASAAKVPVAAKKAVDDDEMMARALQASLDGEIRAQEEADAKLAAQMQSEW